MKTYILYILIFITSLGFSQVEVATDTTNIRIGEQFEYTISVDETENVIIPKLENLKGFEIIKEDKTDTIKNQLIKKYVLTGFDSGAFYIPQQQIFIRNQAYLTDSLLVNVATIAIDTTKIKQFPIKAIKREPYIFDDFKPYFWWLALALLVIGLILYFVLKKKKEEISEEVIPALPPFEEAMEKLQELDKKLLWQNNHIKAYYSELTEILRGYISRDIEISTLELTSNEILTLINKQNNSKKLNISSKTISNIQELLRNADFVKFAKLKPMANEIETDRKTTEKIIKKIQLKIKEYQSSFDDETSIEIKSDNSKETPLKKKNKKVAFDKKKVIKTAILVVIMATSVNYGTKAIKYLWNQVNTLSTEQILKDEWKINSYGNPAIVIETPVKLVEEKIPDLPEDVQKMILSMNAYGYKSLFNNFQIVVSSNSYIPEIITNIDGAVNGSISKMKGEPGVSNFTESIEPYNNLGVEGKKITGTLLENGIEKEYYSFFFVSKNKMWMLIIVHKKGDNAGEKIANRIINSIEIKNVE